MPNTDEFYELAKRRRNIRGFEKKDVPDEYIQKILEIARWAPSAGNSQPWEFIVIRDSEMRQKIAKLFIKQQEQKREMERAVRGRFKTEGAGFKNAPVYILVVGDPRVNEAFPIRTREEKGLQHFVTSLANSVLLIHLAAASLGLGSQYVSDASSPYMATMLKAFLGIPEYLKIYELIPIAYPKKMVQPPPRRPLEEIVHYDRYEAAKGRDEEAIKRFLESMTRKGFYGKWIKRANQRLTPTLELT